jgi:hypothetical protein
MGSQPSEDIPVLTDIVEPDGRSSKYIDDTALFLGELEAHLTAMVQEQTDELVHSACREVEALLLEQVSDRLKAELPGLIAKVISDHFHGPSRTN